MKKAQNFGVHTWPLSNDLFKTLQATIVEPTKPKKPRKRKDSTVINETIKIFFNELKLISERSNVSCGIRDFDPVSDIFEECLLSDVNNEHSDPRLTPEQYKMFKEIMMRDFLMLMRKHINHHRNSPWAFYMISLNEFANKDLIEILDKHCYMNTEWRKNPNSGNNIKIWLF